MDVLRITPRGFCHGVVDAIRLANEAGAAHEGPVYMLGYLVHNAHVVDELAENGVKLVDFDDRIAGLEQIDHGTVILTAHGVSPAVKQRAIDKGLTVIDATCSDVYITHDLIIDLAVARLRHQSTSGSEDTPSPTAPWARRPATCTWFQRRKTSTSWT